MNTAGSRRFGGMLLSVIAATAIFTMVGCEEIEGPETAVDETELTLWLDQAFQEKAYIRLNHGGNQEDYWYYMVTEDMLSDAATLLKEHISATLESAGEIVGNTGTNRNITVEDLDAKTSYRIIAARLLSDGSITGNVPLSSHFPIHLR